MRILLLAVLAASAATPSKPQAKKNKLDIPKTCEALFRAAAMGDAKAIEAALAGGADPDCKSGAGTTALMVAATNGKAPAVKPLLEKGAKIDAQDKTGATALMFAAMLGKDDVVSALLDKGADRGLKTKSGRTALELAKDGAPKTAGAIKLLSAKARP
jgi:ankyrin repeat protein